MIDSETKLHIFTNGPYPLRNLLPLNMSSLSPTFDRSSRSVSLDTISSYVRPGFNPMSAENVQEKRYEPRNRDSIPNNKKNCLIPPMTMPLQKAVPPGWRICIHPEGCIYYLRESDEDSWKVRLITQADLTRDGIPEMIEDIAQRVYSDVRHYPSFPREVDLVLELMDAGNTTEAGYYFVHHKNKCLFWLEEFDGVDIFRECSGVNELSHKQIELEAQYWKHIDLFPHASAIHFEVLQELRQIIRFAIGDCMTSEVSAVCAFSVDVLNNALTLIKDVDVEKDSDYIRSAYDQCFIARMMNHFKHCQYLNYHGQRGARLSRDQSVHGDTYEQRSVIMKCLAPLLFNAPYDHLRSLHKLYVDSIVNHLDWRAFVQRLNAEMQELNLLATVFLSVNVGFLAIQSVDSGAGHSVSQVASYVSVISSFGSMLLGVKLTRTSHAQGPDMVNSVHAHLEGLLHPKHGLEKLAIVYSLPYALLMWGMIFFVVAFLSECFHWLDTVSVVPVSVLSLIVLALVLVSWEMLGGSTLKGSEQWAIEGDWIKDIHKRMLAALHTFPTGMREKDSRLQNAVA